MPILLEKTKTWRQGARKPSPQASLKTSGSSTTLSSKSTRPDEKVTTDSSVESLDPANIVDRLPDLRMFELARELDNLKKKEEVRLAQEAAKWRGGKGPVDPSEHCSPRRTSNAVDVYSSSRKLSKSSFKIRHGLFGSRNQSNWGLSSWTNSRQGFRRSLPKKSVYGNDAIKAPTQTQPTSEPFWSAVEDDERASSGRSFRISASIGLDNSTKLAPEPLSKSGSSSTSKRVAWQARARNISESTSATSDSKGTSPGFSGRSLRLPKWVAASSTPSPNDASSARISSRDRTGLGLSLSDIHTTWTHRMKGGTSLDQESLSARLDVSTPACFTRRKGLLDFEDEKSEPSYFSGVSFQEPTPERLHLHTPSSTNSAPCASTLVYKSQGNRGSRCESTHSVSREAVVSTTKRTNTIKTLAKKDWYQIRMDAILQDHAGFDHTAEAEASVQNIPDHLPNSPLCPQHPKHKSSGSGICLFHGKSRPAFGRAELSL